MKAVEGIIVTGLGEGSYFMSLEHYKKEIKEKLGFDPYQGTLNLKVGSEKESIFGNLNSIMVRGFKSGDKKFYNVRCYKAKIKDIEGAVIIPQIDKHEKDVIEFIAPVNVKSELNLKDGDKVKVELIN